MLDQATITVDLAKIAENTRRIVAALPGIDIVGVTKVTCGSPEVARAMLAGGASALGESRLENVARLREAGITAPVWLLRAPTPGLADECVRLAVVSAISDVALAVALDAAAARVGVRHDVVAMVDIGDLREGMMPAELPAFLEAVEPLPNVDVVGIGASLTCYGAIVPDARNLGVLGELARAAELQLDRRLVVSGGSSTSIDPVMHGLGHDAIDNLRIGEAIVLGVDPATREGVPGLELHTDALTLSVPVIECAIKPSKPIGTCTQDAFGTSPVFEDRGNRRRAICALGRQDAPAEGLEPLDPRVQVLGASSDHLVLDVDDLPVAPVVGDALEFRPGYSAVLGLFTSPYVRKVFVGL
jgi:predicted amino acid racemase